MQYVAASGSQHNFDVFYVKLFCVGALIYFRMFTVYRIIKLVKFLM